MSDFKEEISSTYIVRSWAEKNGFADWAIAMIWLILAFVLFQVTAGLVFIGLMFLSGEISSAADIESVLMSRLDLLFIGNTTGQVLFLGAATFLIAKLHLKTEKTLDFLKLRWKTNTPFYIALGALLIVVVQPTVLYLGYLNSLIPFPEYFTDMQISQYEMFEEFLKREGIILFGLFHIAVVPALCEEVLFRGYILHAFEKSWGIITAVVVSGLIFGLFHLQLPNLLPLATLGIMLALMTWFSGSLWPAIVAHFLNNGAAVVLASSFPELAFNEMTAESLPPVWILILSIVLTVFVIRYMMKQSQIPGES